MKYPRPLAELSRALARLPGVGPKTAQRLALFLSLNPETAEVLERVLLEVRSKIGFCLQCGNLAEGELCPICLDDTRDRGLIAVVETPAEVVALERSGEFHGLYHVLGGVLNPLEGVGPEQLRIEALLERLDGVREVLVATSMTVEGEATAAYLAEVLKGRGVQVTRPAYGLPAGGSLDYVDEVTLGRALAHRRPVSEG